MNLKNFSFDELHKWITPMGASRTAALKLFAAVFAHGAQTVEALRAAPQVPKSVWKNLDAPVETLLPRLKVLERRRADDGFVKYLFESPLGGRIEAVRIPIFDHKYVVCVSSQVGCAMACDFCRTGKMGFRRNLQSWEMLDQVMQVREEADRRVGGVVFMGMGEPLLNYNETLKAAHVLRHPAGFSISGKAITLSTVGIVPAIHRFIREEHPFRMAFSLTSAIPEKRLQVLPVEKTHPLPELISAIASYATARRERAMVAYVMIRGFNTGREDAVALAKAFEGIPIKLDLIDVTDPTGQYQPPTAEELSAFRNELQILRAPIARRYSGGKDIGAACGTLEASSYGGTLVA